MSCKTCLSLKNEVKKYKDLYNQTVKELVNVKNLLYYMRPVDLDHLIKIRAQNEAVKKEFVEYRNANNIPLEPHHEVFLRVLQAEISQFDE
jgi:hypothetical protein